MGGGTGMYSMGPGGKMSSFGQSRNKSQVS